MFDLEKAVSKWRTRMSAGGIRTPEVLDELESHLREDFELRVREKPAAQEAFEAAVAELGHPAALKGEFAKTGESLFEHLKRIVFAFTGMHSHQLATNMNNSSPNIESGWSTYLKAATFAFPAAFMWAFSVVFLLPKVNEMCQRAGRVVFVFPQAPLAFRATSGVGSLLVALSNHGLLLAGVAVLAFALLEWRFKGWARYRRTAMGTGVVMLNTWVLISMTLMIISLLLAMPPVTRHAQ